jgi:3-polyprenyl-4-hydroxybenzoate decarboxylase
MATRLDPNEGILVIDKIFGHGLNPSFPDYLGAKVGFDATRTYPFVYEHDRATYKKVSLAGLDIDTPDIRSPGASGTGPAIAAEGGHLAAASRGVAAAGGDAFWDAIHARHMRERGGPAVVTAQAEKVADYWSSVHARHMAERPMPPQTKAAAKARGKSKGKGKGKAKAEVKGAGNGRGPRPSEMV